MAHKKIVIIDDDADMRGFMEEALKLSYEVRTAEDGVRGLEVMRVDPPDLVVLDLLMPRMHGFEVCQKIREDARLKDVKVLISSSKSYLHDVNTAKTAGADSYIVKPFEITALLRKVEDLLGLSQRAALKFWGTRGSLPSPGPLTQRYGGNTPCTELRVGSELFIIDAGSGMRELGNSLMRQAQGKPVNAHLFIGHTHWDHIQGFPFFTPFYLPQNRFQIYGVHGTTQPFADVLAGQMNPTYFPVALKDMSARIEINELEGALDVAGVKVSYHYLNHPGITVGYRFETPEWSICYISDHEPYGRLNAKGELTDKEDAAVAKFAYGADILVSEAQYTDDEYKMKRSWGHSTFGDVLGLAAAAQVKKLVMFHHDPGHTDEMMDRFLAEARSEAARKGFAGEVLAAQEGASLAP